MSLDPTPDLLAEFAPEGSWSARARSARPSPISDLMSRALANPGLISLAAGFVDQATLPVEPTRAALDKILGDPAAARAALQYGTTPGYPPLREQILARLCAADGKSATERDLDIDRVVVTAGSNQLLHLVCESLLDPGDIVLCAAPTYFVFLGMLEPLRARVIGVAADEEGLIPEALDAELARLNARGELPLVKAIYTITSYDNPTGATLSLARRPALLEVARRWSRQRRIYVLEDAAYIELRYAGEPLPSLHSFDDDGESVVYAGTFSKSFSPGLRVGWGILPRGLIEPVCRQKGNIDFGSPHFNQQLLAEVLAGGEFEPHVARIRAAYRDKLHAMLAACDKYLAPLEGVSWRKPTGGLYVWVTLPEGLDAGPSGRLFDLAVQEGMLYVPGEYGYPPEGEPVRRNTIRLSFGVQPAPRIEAGIAALARAIERARL